MNESSRLTLGSLENITIPALGLVGLLVKVDTGAFSGALHCTDICEEGGELFFTPLGKKRLKTSTRVYKRRFVRSASGHKMRRYVIPMMLVVQGNEYDTLIGLSDRTFMKREMILGRRFLIENNALVDVSLTKDIDDEAEMVEL